MTKFTELEIRVYVEPVVAWTVCQGETNAQPVIGETNAQGCEHLNMEFPRDVRDEDDEVPKYRYVPAAPGWFAVMFALYGQPAGKRDGYVQQILGQHSDQDFRGDHHLLNGNQHVVVQARSTADAPETDIAKATLAAIKDILDLRYPGAPVKVYGAGA